MPGYSDQIRHRQILILTDLCIHPIRKSRAKKKPLTLRNLAVIFYRSSTLRLLAKKQ